ncbi:MAG: hypothetical protein ACK41W_13755 [Cyanobacteriota bacterium]|jgi:PIN domain nuclease of toxin-antitoxin system
MSEQHPEPVHQLPVVLGAQGFQLLARAAPIEAAAVVIRGAAPSWIHRDPFDRVLVVQAPLEDLRLFTADGGLLADGDAVDWVSGWP